MIYRFSASPLALILITLSILIGSAGIMTDQVRFLLANHNLNFLPDEIGMESNIVILIAGFGVFLEHRRWLLERIYPDGIPEPVDLFDKYSHDIGVLLILIAILMESADILFLAFNTWGLEMTWLKYVEISTLFFMNIVAVCVVAVFGFKLVKQ